MFQKKQLEYLPPLYTYANYLDVTTLISALQNLDQKHHKTAQALASQFLNYEVPVVTIENRNREDVGIIFERINNTGTKLSPLDLMTAWTWTKDFHLIEASNEFMEELESKGFGGIQHKTLLQIISGIIQNSTQSKNILSLSGEEIRDNWNTVQESIKKGIDFLSTDLKCCHLDFLPFHQQLIGISKFFQLLPSPSANQLKIIRQWFWKTSFSKRYSSGQTNAKIDSDISNILSLSNGDSVQLESYSYDVTPEMLISTKFSKGNPITRASLLLMAQFDPYDLIKNQPIDIGKSLSQYNRKEFHHIFPNAFLKKRGLTPKQIFSIINFCFLSSKSNKIITNKAPSDYFATIIPKDDYVGILNSNLIPISKDIYKNDDYSAFQEKRASLFMAKIDDLIT